MKIPSSQSTTIPSSRWIWIGASLLLLATTLFPIYVPLHHTNAVTYYSMLRYAPWGVLTPFLLIGGTVAARTPRKGYWLASNLLLLASVVAILSVNAFSDTNAATPEPYTTIAILSYILLVPILLLAALIGWALRRKGVKTNALAELRVKDVQRISHARNERYRHKRKEQAQALKSQAMQHLQSGRVDYANGAFLAILGPIAGALVWLGLWEVGFIASVSAYVMVRLTILLYQKGSGSPVIDKRALWIILGYTAFGLLLSFFAAFTSDVLKIIVKEIPADQRTSIPDLLTRTSFWRFDFSLLKDPSILSGYAGSFAFAVGLSALGLYGTVVNVLLPNHRAATLAKAELAQKAARKPDDWSIN